MHASTTRHAWRMKTVRMRGGRDALMRAEEIGITILSNLDDQRQTIHRIGDRVSNVDSNVGRARNILNTMARRCGVCGGGCWTHGAQCHVEQAGAVDHHPAAHRHPRHGHLLKLR